MRPVVKVAYENQDLRFCGSDNMTLDSSKNQLKIFEEGGGTINVSNGGFGAAKGIVELTHNLGYQPHFRAWFKQSSSSTWDILPGSFTSGDTVITGALTRATDNILQLHFYELDMFAPSFSIDVDYEYIIYIDPYNDAWDA